MSPALDLSNGVSASLSNGASHSSANGLHTNGGSHPLKSKPTPPTTTDGFSTLAIHTGSHPDPSTGAVIPPISLSTTFAQSSPGVHLGFEYSRSDNPNRRALEELLASIEVGGKEGLGFASGSAATGVVVQALGGARVVEREGRDGERVRDVEVPHVLSVNDVYGGTYRYLKRVASEGQGLEVTLLDIENATEEDVRAAIRPNTKVSSPSFPFSTISLYSPFSFTFLPIHVSSSALLSFPVLRSPPYLPAPLFFVQNTHADAKRH